MQQGLETPCLMQLLHALGRSPYMRPCQAKVPFVSSTVRLSKCLRTIKHQIYLPTQQHGFQCYPSENQQLATGIVDCTLNLLEL